MFYKNRKKYIPKILFFVVISARDDGNGVIFYFVYDTMFSCNTPRPISGKTAFKRFGLSDSGKGGLGDIFQNLKNAFENFAVMRFPVLQIRFCRIT